MALSGDFDKLKAFGRGLGRLSKDGRQLTRVAMDAARLLSDSLSEQGQDGEGRRWAPLALSTLRHRRRGPILLRIHRSRRWRLLSAGRFSVQNTRKPHDIYHTTGTRKMPQRADLPVSPAAHRLYGEVMQQAMDERIAALLLVAK